MVTSDSSEEMTIVKKVLERVCVECQLAYAEVMQPTETGMVLTAANFCRSDRERGFYNDSKMFTFPIQVRHGFLPALSVAPASRSV
jgi:hypothetical protein